MAARPRAPASVQEPPARYLPPGQTVLLDTCVVLDLLLLRQPFAAQACALFEQAERGQLQAVLCATTLTTIDYLACKQVGRERSRAMLQDLLALCGVAPVTRAVLDAALRSPMADFEDAVLAAAAQACGAQAIITRNVRDFALCSLPVHTPAQWLAAG
ncbi:PIN domain-containing protein [Vandammella animalimorsus]|uniref:PIN domain nuclease n=1 Tax=Vandammella animalimorsus TaxID=2029117 RepID=A0A2A2A8Q6_9BURK|nr:PIN domain-containing protein [Vandammella animalimorsus]PAT34183.1 PIN domain nuclease [Vandammella animalimorsus]